MGFDIECIIDIHTYPGEFFCPVCRTLVYPNEALQSQCTHLYCKPCLAHIANGSRACPYDGYLVTESDSKPLIESDKALADRIGNVKVHCLFHRSGCTWEGPLSECTSHCSGCTFGNSPVICNRCGVQIVHRQVHDHAQSCPGVYQTQQTAESAQGAANAGPSAATTAADSNQTSAQPGAPTSQAQNPQSTAAPLLPGQDINQQPNPNFQAPAVATSAVPTPDQWYQQYYQQYAGYDTQQQPYHQYYPNQQQPLQQYPQHSLFMQGQPHAQPQPPQTQLQPQLHSQTQPIQPQPKVHSQPQPPLQPQTQSQSQVPSQGQPPMHAPVRAPVPGNQPNPLQQVHPAMQSQSQVPTQPLPPPPSQSTHQPPPYAQGQSQPQPVSMRPPVQQQQIPQYSQPQSQMYYSQASQLQHPPQMHPQPQLQPQTQLQPQLQTQPQTQLQPQLQTQPQTQLQPQLQTQPQAHLQHPPQSHPQLRPQLNQPGTATAQPQVLHPSAPAVTGHHSYPQPQPAQQMQSGAMQQHPMHPYPTNGSISAVNIHGQVSQQPALMRPPHSHGQPPHQQVSTVLPPQAQFSGIPPAQQQQVHPQAQQPVHQIQHVPGMQPIRQMMPQQPFAAPVQSQLHQHGHFMQQQQPPQPQVHMIQQNVAVPQSLLPQQSQNYVGRPVIANHVIQPQPFPQSSTGFGAAQHKPGQQNINQPSTHQSYARSGMPERPEDHILRNHGTGQEVGSSAENVDRKDTKVLGTDADVKSAMTPNNDQNNIAEMVDESGQTKTVDKDADRMVDAAEDGAGSSLNSSNGKLVETAAAEDKYVTDIAPKDEIHSSVNCDSKQQPLEHQKAEIHKATDAGPSSADSSRGPHTDGHPPRPQVQGHPKRVFKPQGPGLPQPGQSSNQIELQSPLLKTPYDAPFSGISNPGSNAHFGRGAGQLGPRPGNFELHSVPQGPPPHVLAPGSVHPRGIMGRAPPPGSEVHFGSYPVRSNEPERGLLGRPHGVEPIPSRMNVGSGPDSSKFLHDEKVKAFAGDYSNSFQMESAQLPDPARSFDLHHAGGVGPPSRFLPSHHFSAGLPPNIGGERDSSVPYNGNNKGRTGPGRGHPDSYGPGPDFGRDHMTHFPPRSPEREYHGISSRGFGSISTFPHGHSGFNDIDGVDASGFAEGSRSFNPSSDPIGRDGRFPHLSGHMWRGDTDGSGNSRFIEHMAPGLPLNHLRDDIFGQDIMSGQPRGGDFLGPRNFSSHLHMGDPAGYGPISSFPRLGEPGFRSNYSLQGDAELFDKSRKRNSMGTGWCRICRVDCETVEGLEMHSQTREHQKMAMDLVKTIKQQSRKKQKTSGGRAARDEVGKTRNIGYEGRGNKL